FPLGQAGADLRNVVPIEIRDNDLYFGTSMNDDTTEENGIYIKMDITAGSFSYETEPCQTSSAKHSIFGDVSARWFLRGAADETAYATSSDWEWGSKFNTYENYVDVDTFGSNIVFHIFKSTGAVNGSANEDLIQYLGTPKTPFLSMDNDSTSALIRGTQLRYYMAYKMYSTKTTHLSAPTEAIEIPQINVGQTFTTPGFAGDDKLDAIAHGYDNGDVVWVSSDDTLPTTLVAATDYYVINKAADDFEVSLTAGGSAVSITSA
ncbi:unnamed protein product, partial [marine sediment metagenome]